MSHFTQSTPISSAAEEALRPGDCSWPILKVAAGSLLFASGDPGDCMYRIRSGRIEIVLHDAEGRSCVIDELNPGDPIGEMALLSGQPRSAGARAVTDVELDVISSAEFDRLAAESPERVTALARGVLPRMRRAQAAGLLARLFGQLDVAELCAVETDLAWVELRRDETLFRQGDPSDALYLVVHGRVRYTALAGDGSERVRWEAGPGETIGEFGLFTGAPRSATVTAMRDTALLCMTRPVFDDLSRRYPRVTVEIARNAFARQQRQAACGALPEEAVTSFALVAASLDVPLELVAQRLAEALGVDCPTLHLSSARVDTLLGRPGLSQLDPAHPTQIMFEAWLDDRERRHRYLIYQADASPTPWTERCLRQADIVLVVGDGAANPGDAPPSQLLARWARPEQTMLVLLQPAGRRRPAGTAAWLDRFPVRAHYHVRPDVPDDLAHLARCLTGRGLGLVLSGGGARGFGHIGVLRALRESGMTADYIGGTSMGALVSAVWASGRDDRELQSLSLKIGSRKALLDRTLPIVSFYRTSKITDLIRDLVGDMHVEDLWLPYFCISCNLSRGAEMVHTRGPLWEALRASMAAAPIYAPLLINGDLVVDGGFLNNLPLDVMRSQIGSGTVVGVDCVPLAPRRQAYDFGPSISGWTALWDRLRPFGRRASVPDMLDLLTQIIDSNALYRLRFVKDSADLILRLPGRDWGSLDFDHCGDIIEAGYRAASEQLAAWRATAHPA